MERIETRLWRLERQNQIYRNLFILAALVLVAVLGYGATEPVPEVIQARKFEVVNEAGRAVVIIQSWKHGGVIVVMNKSGEFPSISIGHANDGSGLLRLHAKEAGKRAVTLSSNPAGNGFIATFSKEGNDLVRISSSNAGGSVRVSNKTGERVVQIHVDEYGNGVVGAYDRKGKGRTLEPGP